MADPAVQIVDPEAVAAVEVWMPGSPGRWPFAGHVRGRWAGSGVRVAWAGRIAWSALPEEAYEAADALRDALATVQAETRFDAVARIWAAIAELPERWRTREDLSILIAAADAEGIALSAAGLTGVWVQNDSGWVTAALSGSPLFTEPGVPARAPTPQPPLRSGVRFVGLPRDIALPRPADIALACGVRP